MTWWHLVSTETATHNYTWSFNTNEIQLPFARSPFPCSVFSAIDVLSFPAAFLPPISVFPFFQEETDSRCLTCLIIVVAGGTFAYPPHSSTLFQPVLKWREIIINTPAQGSQ